MAEQKQKDLTFICLCFEITSWLRKREGEEINISKKNSNRKGTLYVW